MRFSWRRVLLGWALASLADCGGGTAHLSYAEFRGRGLHLAELTAPAPGSATLS